MNNTNHKNQHLANWHNRFVEFIGKMQDGINDLEITGRATNEEKRAISYIKILLDSQDVADVKRDLAIGIVKKSTIEKIEKIDKDIIDTLIKYSQASPLFQVFLKILMYNWIDRMRNNEITILNTLHIPIEND